MKKIILRTSLLVLFPFSFALADNFSQDVVLKKSLRWLSENQSIARVQLEKSQDVAYSPEALYLEILKVLREKKPSAALAYNVLYNFIKTDLTLAKTFSAEIMELTDILGFTEEQKEKIQKTIPSNLQNQITFVDQSKADAPSSIPEIIKMVQDSINALPFPASMKFKMLGSIDTVKKVLIESLKDDDCYHTSSGCQFSSNKGIIQYYSTRALKNHELSLATLRMGIRIHKLNLVHAEALKKAPLYNDKTGINLWPLFLDVAGGDGTLALEVMSMFGHDVMSNTLASRSELKFLTYILNAFRPSQYGGDDNPKSVMFLPGAVNGILPSKRVVKKLDEAIAFYTQVYGKGPGPLRHGYHHIYGGLLMTQEILAAGDGQIGTIDLGSFISEVMGYAYKKLQLPRYLKADGLALWKAMQLNEFNQPVKPAEWDQARFDKAWAELQYHIAIMDYTENQHLLGAKFAMKVYQDKMR